MSQSNLIAIRQFGEGEPILLIHGLLMNGTLFQPLVPFLLSRRRILIPDLRGSGNSKHLLPPYTPTQHARDLAHLLDTLEIDSACVLGYSQGGTVAQQFAHDFPERVRRLYLVCTFAYNQITWREKFEGFLMPWLLRLSGIHGIARLLARNASELDPEQQRQLEGIINDNTLENALLSLEALRDFDSRDWLKQLRCETLIVAGDSDTAVPLHHAHMLQAAIPQSRLLVMTHAGHTLLWTHTAQLAALILDENEVATIH